MSGYDDYLATLKAEDGGQDRLVSSLSEAALTSPDEFAKMKALSKAAAISVDAVPQYHDEAKQAKFLGEVGIGRLWKDAPLTSDFLSLPDNAKVASDDVQTLSGFEQAASWAANRARSVAAALPTASSGMWGFAAAPFELVGADSIGGWLRDKQAEGKQWAKRWGAQDKPGWFVGAVDQGLTSFGQNMLTLPLAFLPGGQIAALAGMVAPVFGEAYGKGRDAGLSPLQSINYGAQDAAAEWAGERLGLGNLVKNVRAGSGVGKTMIDYLLREVPSELATTVAQSFNEYANISPDKSVGEWVQQLPEELAQTVIATLVGGGAITTTVAAADKALSMVAGKGQQAGQASEAGQLLGELNRLAEASKVRERDPETAQAFFQSVLADGNDSVWISAEALAQSGLADQMAQAIPSVAEQLGTAAEAGHDIRIPVADLLATMAGPELAQSILPHVSTEPGGFTATTAEEYMQSGAAQELQAEVERVLGDREGDETFKSSANEVEEAVFAELQSAGRHSESVNRADAMLHRHFFSVMAAKIGDMPKALFDRYALKVVAKGGAAGAYGQVAKPRTAEFRAWFDGSKVSKPVYHATASDFDAFDTSKGDLGAHFGTVDQANRVAERRLPGRGDISIMPVWLSIKNPLRLKDVGSFHADGIALQLEKKGLLPKGEGKRIEKEIDGDWRLRKKYDPIVLEAIKDAGYDGVVYSNTNEGAGDSYIAFDPTQIKSATGNRGTFDPSDPSILNQGEANRGTFSPTTNTISLLAGADLSTFLHESGHFFLEIQADLAAGVMQEAAIRGAENLTDGERSILADTQALLDWFGVEDLNAWGNLGFEERRSYHEKFARGFEAYLYEGKAPSIELHGMFQRFRAWLLNVYKSLKALNVEVTPEVSAVFDRMLATTEEIQQAEQARSMMDLFATPEQAGMTPEEFAAYHALGTDATNGAIEELQARGIRDLQWIKSARGRTLAKIKKESKARRAEIEMAARREVMSQPVYRAWQLLTARMGKDDMLDAERRRSDYRDALKSWNEKRAEVEASARSDAKAAAWEESEEGRTKYRRPGTLAKAQAKVLRREADAIDAAVAKSLAEWEQSNRKPGDPDARPKADPKAIDPETDSLLPAIAKLGGLNKAEVVSTWGTNPADKPQSGVFGMPVWRLGDDGLSIDGMAEALAQYGYLTQDQHGKVDVRELEELFADELGGTPRYSSNADFGAMMAPPRAGEDIANPGALQAARLDRDSLLDTSLTRDQIKVLKARKMTAAEGLHPDIVADQFPEFSSGDALVRALVDAVPPQEAIDALTDRRMLEQFGELSSPAAIEQAADMAIHNEVRARAIATELAALDKAMNVRGDAGADRNGRKRTFSVLPAAAKQFASEMIARLKIRDVLPGQYSGAAARAAKAAVKAEKAGDIATAAAEKRTQLLNIYATRAAHEAREEVAAGVRYLKKFDGDIKALDPGYADQIHKLLERFDLRATSLKEIDKRASLVEWLAGQREAGFEPDIPAGLENEATKKPYKEMTVEEFRGLVDTVKQIDHLGRLKNRLLKARDLREYKAISDEIVASINANAQGRTATARTPTTNMGRIAQAVRRFGAAHIKAAALARVMDGGIDGGTMWEHFIRVANESGDMETTMRADATLRLSEILEPVLKLGRMGGSGVYFPAIDRSLNRESRIAIALNTGNAGNLQRLLGGEGWNMAQLTPVLQSLSKQEWQAVQEVWDHIETYRPQIAAKEMRVYGKEPTWIDPVPFSIKTADGATINMRGGYYPIKYDPAASQRAEEHSDAEAAKRQLQGAYTSATTKRSYTKQRAEEVSGRPLLYSLAGLYSGVNEVIHDLAWHEWLIDTNRLLRSHTIDQAIRSHYGPEAKAQLKTWAADIAEGDKAAANAGEALLGRLRQGISAAGLGFNVVSAAMQITGFNQSIVRIGAAHVGRGVAKYIGSPVQTTREVAEKSPFMAARARTQFRELNELANRVQDGSKTMNAIRSGAYYMMSRMQRVVDVPTWLGGYEKAIADGNDEERAIALADQSVIDSQGSGMTKDLSAVERGGPALKLFTVFYSYMNTALNMGVGRAMTQKNKGKLAAEMLMLYTVPVVLGYAIRNALVPGGDDDDWLSLAKALAAEQLSYLFGTMIVVREFGAAAKIVAGSEGVRDYQGPAGLRAISDAIAFAKQAKQGEFDDAFRKAAINLIGDLSGLPAAQINRSITGAQALADGETSNPAAAVFGFQRQ